MWCTHRRLDRTAKQTSCQTDVCVCVKPPITVCALRIAQLVLEAFDNDASSLGDDDDYENVDRTFASTSVPGQVFRYDVKFRADRTLSCRMHALQNVFQPLLKACLNIQGLSNSATTAQNSATIQLNPPCCQPIQQSETYQHPISNPT